MKKVATTGLLSLMTLALRGGCVAGGPETIRRTDVRDAGNDLPASMPEEVQDATADVQDAAADVQDATADVLDSASDDEGQETTMRLQIGETALTATLADNSSAEALAKLLALGPVSIEMKDYARMEKVGSLGTNLPTNDEMITTAPGDLILYMGNAFVIYYAQNTWSLTRLGRINGVTQTELKEALGNGDVTVTLSLE